eukprot:3592403-Pyramimonas_sp.AAC.1
MVGRVGTLTHWWGHWWGQRGQWWEQCGQWDSGGEGGGGDTGVVTVGMWWKQWDSAVYSGGGDSGEGGGEDG